MIIKDVEHCKRKLKSGNGRQWGLIYNWVRQGSVRVKTFRQLLDSLIEEEAQRKALEILKEDKSDDQLLQELENEQSA